MLCRVALEPETCQGSARTPDLTARQTHQWTKPAWPILVVLPSVAWCQTGQPLEALKPGTGSGAVVQSMRFTIAEIRIIGNTLVTDEQLQADLAPLLGSGKTIDDLNRARQTIVAAYRLKGYELLSVNYNARASRGGIHLFTVSEVTVGKITVTGNAQLSAENIRRQLPSLVEGGTPQLTQLARELFLFNDNRSRAATLAYTPGGPGATDVEIKVTEKPQLHAAVTLKNTGTAATGVWRAGLTVNHDNVFDRSHQLSVTAVTSPEQPSRVRQVSLSYQVPLPSLGDRLVFSASDSSTDTGLVADLFNVSGKGSTFAAHYLRNLARDAISNHTLDMGYDERKNRDVVDFFGVNLGNSVTTRPVTLGYRYSRSEMGDNRTLGVTLQRNVPGGALNSDAAYAAARAGAKANWQTWQFDANWQRELASGWMPVARLYAQYSRDPLISAEQFGLGGQNAVRGFDEREGAGDRGWHGHLEVYGPRIAVTHRFFGFLDAGKSARLNAQLGELAAQKLASYGLGWRAQFKNGLNLSADAAAVANGTALHPKGSKRLHFSAAWVF